MVDRVLLYSEVKQTVTRIIPELATEIGLNESILLLQLFHWLKISDNIRDDEYWTYQSIRDMRKKAFPYWGVNTINRAVKSLIAQGLIKETDKYNTKRYDKTRWFALIPAKLAQLTSITVMVETSSGQVGEWNRLFQNGTRSSQNGTPIPETPTEITTEKKAAATSAPLEQPNSTTADDAKQRVYDAMHGNMGQTVTPMVAEDIRDYLADGCPPDWMVDAIREAVDHNARTWKYVKAILDRWLKEGRDEKPKVTTTSATNDTLNRQLAAQQAMLQGATPDDAN